MLLYSGLKTFLDCKTEIKLALLLLLKSVFLILVILYAHIGLGPDEAQYWTWSQNLSWGYYSKPPAIAWQIWLGCLFFGQTELGVRFFSVILGAALAVAIFFLAKRCGLSSRQSFFSAVSFALSPIGMVGSFLAITDAGLALFWTLASLALVKSIEKKENYYFLTGCFVLCGALFKWPIYLFWGGVFLASFIFPSLFSWKWIQALAFSLLGLIPSLIWNVGHDFVTFKHVFATIIGQHEIGEIGTAPLQAGNFSAFLGAQIALVSPLLFGFLLFALVKGMFNPSLSRQKSGLFFCMASSCFVLIGYLVLSCFQKMQGNWCSFIYPTAFICLGWISGEWKKGVYGGVWLSLGLVLFVFSIPNLQRAGVPIPFKINPFRHNVGWDQLPLILEKGGYSPDKHFLCADKYQLTSLLSFYGPLQKRAYFLNLLGLRFNQFSFWPGLKEERVGQSGYFMVVENRGSLEGVETFYLALLKPYFNSVRFVSQTPLFYVEDKPVKTALLFFVDGYSGKIPPSFLKY